MLDMAVRRKFWCKNFVIFFFLFLFIVGFGYSQQEYSYETKDENKALANPEENNIFTRVGKGSKSKQETLEDIYEIGDFSHIPKSRQKREITDENRKYYYIGGVVLIVIAVIIFLIIICLCTKKKRKKKKNDKRLSKAVKKSTMRSNSQTKVPSPNAASPPMEMRVDNLPLPVVIPESTADRTMVNEQVIMEPPVQNRDINSEPISKGFEDEARNLTETDRDNIRQPPSIPVTGSNLTQVSSKNSHEIMEPVTGTNQQTTAPTASLHPKSVFTNMNENMPINAEEYAESRSYAEERNIKDIHSQSVQVLPATFNPAHSQMLRKTDSDLRTEEKYIYKTDSLRKMQSHDRTEDSITYTNERMASPSSKYDPKNLDRTESEIEHKINTIETTMLTIESNLSKLKDLTKGIEQDLHQEPRDSDPYPNEPEAYSNAAYRQNSKPKIPPKKGYEYSESLGSLEYNSSLERGYKSPKYYEERYEHSNNKDGIPFSDDSELKRQMRSGVVGSESGSSRYNSLEERKPKIPPRKRGMMQNMEYNHSDEYGSMERTPRHEAMKERYGEPIPKDVRARDELQRGHSLQVQDERYRDLYTNEPKYKPNIPKKSNSFVDNSRNYENRKIIKPLPSEDPITEEYIPQDYDKEGQNSTKEEIKKTKPEDVYANQDEEDEYDIPIPDPDYLQQSRNSKPSEENELDKPAIKPKPKIKPREFKGPYSLEDLDDMYNPLTVALRNRPRRAPIKS